MPGFPAYAKHEGQQFYLGTFPSEPESTAAQLIALAELRHAAPDLPAALPADLVTRLTEQVRTRLAVSLPITHQPTRLRKDNTRGLRGVYSTPKPWKAEIAAGRRRFMLGTYRNEYEAALAYNEAAILLHGPTAVLNVIPAQCLPTQERTDHIRQEVAKRLDALTPSPEPALVG